MNTALEYSTRVVQEGGRRCKKSTLNDLVHLTPLRIPFMNPPSLCDTVPYSTVPFDLQSEKQKDPLVTVPRQDRFVISIPASSHPPKENIQHRIQSKSLYV
jgi:hypothetical protein